MRLDRGRLLSGGRGCVRASGVSEQNGSASILIAFECECGDVCCWETVSLFPTDYAAFRAANNGAPLLAPKHDYVLRRGSTRLVSPIVS
jgi:hypothetical protein